MKRIQLLACTAAALAAAWAFSAPDSNLCYNSDFSSEKGHFDGWTVDFDWTGNSHWQGNALNVSFLPEFKGKQNVLKMKVPKGYESKVETPLVAYKTGERYKCTFDICVEDVTMKMRVNGYSFKPGIRPYDPPKLQDMRPVYRTEQMDVNRGAWRTVSMEFPNNSQISQTAYNHLKKVRYISVLTYVPGETYGAGNFYIANMRIVKLPGEVKIKK
jgi:hypothetical protein